MKRFASLLLAIPMALSLLAASSASASVVPQRHQNLTALRVATVRFHSLEATAASGRVDLHLCVDMMGQHYANQATFSDGVLDPIHPEAMVYEDNGHGHLHLVAVEWVSTTPGEVMHMALHFNPDVGLWVLHAWIWKHNPAGMFADMNPRVGNCPA